MPKSRSGLDRQAGDGVCAGNHSDHHPQFIHGLRGSLHVTFEEGPCAAWLHDLVKPDVTEVLVCNPRKNALLKVGNKSDRIDARKLADLLHGGHLWSVYHGENGVRTLQELARRFRPLVLPITSPVSGSKAGTLTHGWSRRSK